MRLEIKTRNTTTTIVALSRTTVAIKCGGYEKRVTLLPDAETNQLSHVAAVARELAGMLNKTGDIGNDADFAQMIIRAANVVVFGDAWTNVR